MLIPVMEQLQFSFFIKSIPHFEHVSGLSLVMSESIGQMYNCFADGLFNSVLIDFEAAFASVFEELLQATSANTVSGIIMNFFIVNDLVV
jgi:hypothetical protein